MFLVDFSGYPRSRRAKTIRMMKIQKWKKFSNHTMKRELGAFHTLRKVFAKMNFNFQNILNFFNWIISERRR